MNIAPAKHDKPQVFEDIVTSSQQNIMDDILSVIMKQVDAVSSSLNIVRNRHTTFEVDTVNTSEDGDHCDWASTVATDGEGPMINKKAYKKKDTIYQNMKNERNTLKQGHICEWIIKHAPIGELWDLTFSQRKEIGKRLLAVHYSILPPSFKSSFIIQFDMENPRPRFIVKHLTLDCEFKNLPAEDKVDLVKTSLIFAEKFDMRDAILSIPIGRENQRTVIYHRFYAYIHVHNRESYCHLFDSFTKTEGIPFWPQSNRWVTPLWIPMSLPVIDNSCYMESILVNSSIFPCKEFDLLDRRHFIFKGTADATASPERLTNFETHSWKERLLVGICNHEFMKSHLAPVNRWQYLEFMFDLVQHSVQKNKHFGCSLLLTLARPFSFRRKHRVLGIVKFLHKVPSKLIDEAEKDHRVTVVADGVAYKEHDVAFGGDCDWMVIDDVCGDTNGDLLSNSVH